MATLFSLGAFAQGPPPVVSVVPAREHPVSSALTLVGSIEPYTRSLIASEVAGLVEAMPVEEGDRLEAGAVICRLRDTTRRLSHAEASATLSQLEQQLAELEAGTRVEEIARAKAEMDEAQALADKWQRELERVRKLLAQDSAAEKEYHDVIADTEAARARLAQAKATHDLAVAGPRTEEIARARFAVESQRAVVARLKYDLDQTVIRAPFAGYVTREETEVGEWINSGGPVVELLDLERVLVRVDVPESAIAGAMDARAKGLPVAVTVEALSQTVRGQIKHIIPQADEKARTFPVEIELDNKSGDLKSGMFVRARVPAGPVVKSIIVPRDATLQRGRAHYVVIATPAPPPAEGTMATPVPVQLGADVGNWVAIASPAVQPGVPVAVKGHDRIYGPQPVQAMPVDIPVPPEGPPASQPASSPAQVDSSALPRTGS